MKNSYTVIIKVSDRLMLADLLDAIGPYSQSAEISIDNSAPSPAAPPKAVPRFMGITKRGPKRSKVNDAIRTRLGHGQATISDLKSALEGAGMSAASLSTGIAALTKSGEIYRVGEGTYELKAA